MRWDLEGPISSGYFDDYSHPFFMNIRIEFSAPTNFAGQVVYKPRVPSVSSEALMPITAILMPAADRVLLLHQLVIGPVTVHLM